MMKRRGHERNRPPTLNRPTGSDDDTPDPSPSRQAWANDVPNTPDYAAAMGSGSFTGTPEVRTPQPQQPGVSPGASPAAQGAAPPSSRNGHCDESTLGSVLVHEDADSDGHGPVWKDMRRADTDSRMTTRSGVATSSTVLGAGGSARHAAMHRARQPQQRVLKFDVSTQVALPTTEKEAAVKRMADEMVAEVEEELEGVTAQRDQLNRELEWYKGELRNKGLLLQEAREQVQELTERLRSAGGASPAAAAPAAAATGHGTSTSPDDDPPAWWAKARDGMMRQLRQELVARADFA